MPPSIRPFVPIALYEGALDALPLGLLVFRLDAEDDPGSLRLLYGNDAADRTTGADFRANLGRTIREFLPSLLETEIAATYAEVARTGRERDLGDVRFGGDLVREALYNVRAFGLPDQSVGVLFEDVTEARRTEEQRLREVTGLTDAAFEGILLSDGRRVLLANRALAEMTGYTREELAALDVLELAADEHREAIRERIEARSTEPYEALLRRKDGTTFPVDIRGRYVEYEGGTVRATAVRDLTERVQALREVHALREAEAALRESESRYRLLADTATDVIVTVGVDNVIRYVNRAAEAVFGYAPDELVGRPLSALMPEAYRDRHEAAMARYVATGEKHVNWAHVEVPGLRKDGTEIPLNISFGEYRHGEDRLFTGILRDVSAQQAAREALAEREATLRAMVEQATVGVMVTDPATGRILRVNERYAEIAGRPAEALPGTSLFDLLPPEEREADRAALAALARGAVEEYAREKRYVLPDGSHRWVSATARLLDTDGPPHAVHIVQDVTEQREAEAAVHRALAHAEEAERRLLAVVDNLPELAWAARPDGYIDFYNRRWYEYTSTTEEEMQGWGWTAVHDPAILPEVEERWRRALATGEPFEMEFPLRGADGAFRWFLTRAHPIRDADGEVVRWVGTNADIDEQRRILAERDAALDRLRESEARLRLVARATNDAIWDWDLPADRVLWNRAVEELFGWAEAAAEGTDAAWWKARIHPDDRARTAEAIEAVIDGTAEAWQAAYRFARADGTWADVLDRGAVIRDADGAAVRMVGAMIDLTEQKRTERALRESERQFRLLTDAVPQLVWTATAEGEPDYYNERWYAYTGMPRPEGGAAPETNWGDYLHPDDREGAFAAFARAAAAGRPFEYEYRFRRHDGAYRWFLGRALPTLDDDGRVARWVGSAIDIQELREAREALAASEAHFRAVFEQAGVGVVIMDPTTGEFLRVNERYTELAGRPAEELLGVSVFDFIHPEDRGRDRERFAALARGEAPAVSHEKRYLHPDGSVRWVKVDARLLPADGAGGARPRAVGVLQDVTEERRAEAALRESEARFRAIADTMPQIVWTTRPDGYHEYFNERWYEFTGMPRPGEPGGLDQGFNWKDYLHPDDVARSVERWEHSLATGEPYEIEYRFRRAADGAYRWFIGRAEPVRDDDGAIARWYGTCTDIHDQKEAARLLEERVAERTAEAREAAERLDAVLNGTTDLIAAIDTDYRVLAVNAGFVALWERIFDFPIRVGMTIEEALPGQPEAQAQSYAQWGRVLAGESFTTLETSEHPVLGKVAFESHYSPIRDAAGAVTGGVAVIRDVTDREQAAQAVEAFAADLRQLHAVTTADHDTTEALLEDYLRAGRAILGLPFAAVVETDEGAGTWRARAGIAPEGAELPAEGPLEGTAAALVLRRGATLVVADTEADGEDAAAPVVAALGVRSYVGTPVYVGDAVAGVLGFASSEPRAEPLAPHEVEIVEILAELVGHALAVEQAQRAEREADLRYRTLVEAMDEGVVLHDAAGRVVAWNEAAERTLGLTADELGGRTPTDARWRAVHDDGRPFPAGEHPAAVARGTGEPQRSVIMGVVHPAGELRWLSVNAVPLRDEEAGPGAPPAGVVSSFADVTALKRAEDALRQRGAELEERNAELEQFAYVASHDLQEPLRTVASFLQLLERRYAADLDARAQEYIAFAVDGSRRMQALIQGLLTYSRVGTRGRPFEPVDAGAVARDVLVDLGPALGEARATVEAEDLPVVCADPTQLHQLLLNLVANAVKFHREGVPPRVGITAAEGREGGRPVWRFAVSDNGIGLEPKYADRVFQLFQRLHTRDEYPGTGIGLAVCKKIVERHGGTLRYSPSPEGGTTFTFTLPIRPLEDCDAPPARGGPNLADAE